MVQAIPGLLLPFLGTSLGAACVFFLRGSLGRGVSRALTGFAGGVMVAASVWSLLLPAIEQAASYGGFAFFPALVGFWGGVLFLLLLDRVIPHLHAGAGRAEGPRSRLARTTMTVLAVTLYEGRNRQIRRMCEKAGLLIKRLRRVAVGDVELGTLAPGKWRRLTREETDSLRNY